MTAWRTISIVSALTWALTIACSNDAEPIRPTYWGQGGVNQLIWPTIKLLEAGQAGEGGSADGGQAGQAGSHEGGSAGVELAGAGGLSEEDCQLPEYLEQAHQLEIGLGRPAVEDTVSTTGSVPYGTIVKFSKYNNWRCDHQPFCDYAVQAPTDEGFPETRRYWEPVRWQGLPPDGKIGQWLGLCTLPQWTSHGTCGGFYRDGDYVDYRDSNDPYAERFVWQCRVGWSSACDVQPPGTGSAWVNVSDTIHCYGY